MRLTEQQVVAIRRATAEVFGEGTEVWLFGSRVDDGKRGGDIDLLVCPGQSPAGAEGRLALRQKIHFLGCLEREMGERKIDVVIASAEDSRPIVKLAHETGIRL